MYWFSRIAQIFIIAVVLYWIGAQLSRITDWSGVGGWIVSGFILISFILMMRRRSQGYWTLIIALAVWSGVLMFLLYGIAAAHPIEGSERLPTWTQIVNPIVAAVTPFILLAAAVFVFPSIWQRKS